MTIKQFCDKCNQEIPLNLDNELHFTSVRKTRYGYDTRINLCDSCIKLFQEWLGMTLERWYELKYIHQNK